MPVLACSEKGFDAGIDACFGCVNWTNDKMLAVACLGVFSFPVLWHTYAFFTFRRFLCNFVAVIYGCGKVK